MKRIRTLPGLTHGITAYRERAGRSASWDGFRRTDGHTELLGELESLQHGLCAYCEIALVPEDRQVEHVVPKSSAAGEARVLDPANLVACCLGGTNPHLRGAGGSGSERFWDPPREFQSCGQAKGNASDAAFLDPRNLPADPPVFRVGPNGKIRASREGCFRSGVDADHVLRTIRVLNLNSYRLRAARKARWDALEDEWATDAADAEALIEAARDELLPGRMDRLREFFTTRRWFFGAAGERVLTEPPQDWI